MCGTCAGRLRGATHDGDGATRKTHTHLSYQTNRAGLVDGSASPLSKLEGMRGTGKAQYTAEAIMPVSGLHHGTGI